MKIIVLSLIIISTIFNTLYSQITFPDENVDQKWEYVTWHFWGGQCQKRIIKNGNKENICEGHYVEIFDCDENEQNCFLVGYYRIKGDSVLIRLVGYLNGHTFVDCSMPYGLIYDFGSNINDELECALNTFNDPFLKEFWISDIQEIEYENVNRTTRFVDYMPYSTSHDVIYNMTWIDGIGSNIHPFYSLSCIGDHCEIEQLLTKVFRNGEMIYQDTILGFSFPCTGWITSIENEIKLKSTMTVWPNPADSYIIIRSESTSYNTVNLIIYDIQGKKLTNLNHYVLGDPLNIEYLSAGMYIIQVFDGKHVQNVKLVKE